MRSKTSSIGSFFMAVILIAALLLVLFCGLAMNRISSSPVARLKTEIVGTYVLENATDSDKLLKMSTITLLEDGTAWLATPPISSYAIPQPCYYKLRGNQLRIQFENGNVVAKFAVEDKNTLILVSATIPLYAEANARYVRENPMVQANYEPHEWLNYFNDENMPWDDTLELKLPEFESMIFKWTPYELSAVDQNGEHVLFSGMPIWNVYLADLNEDGMPELCATVSMGSGIIDERIYVYDYANTQLYELSARMAYDYTLHLENGRLMVKQTKYPRMEDSPFVEGELKIVEGELSFG